MSESGSSVFLRVMKEALEGVDPNSLQHLKIGTGWAEVQVLSDPFVVYRNNKYLPAILVEVMTTGMKSILFVAAQSLAESMEPMRQQRGSLVGLNIRLRKTGSEQFSPYEVEELAE